MATLARLTRPTGGRAGCVNIAGWRRWRILSGLQVCGLCEHCRMATLARLIRPTGVRVV
ncbi:TPA: hypothetical protein SLO72_003447 [Citrobacter koseri]|nr:hypothetical protein [Citrobacter koseri]